MIISKTGVEQGYDGLRHYDTDRAKASLAWDAEFNMHTGAMEGLAGSGKVKSGS